LNFHSLELFDRKIENLAIGREPGVSATPAVRRDYGIYD